MNNLILTCKEPSEFIPHPEGIFSAVCVDVMDLGLVETEYQGQHRMKPKVKLVFESEAVTPDGKRCSVAKSVTASLGSKASLTSLLGKWRGRPVQPNETIELSKLIGACCTLVISHQTNLNGKIYASIDAISKPTKRVAPSGQYDPAAARQRYAEWCLRTASPSGLAPAPTAAAPDKSGAQRSARATTPPAPAPVDNSDDVPF